MTCRISDEVSYVWLYLWTDFQPHPLSFRPERRNLSTLINNHTNRFKLKGTLPLKDPSSSSG
ncbi:MAG TPA: hypothetical protein VKA34_06185, partial [Balneolales bacterium]|nr:hypothetical protein [Balneolales bacterium]